MSNIDIEGVIEPRLRNMIYGLNEELIRKQREDGLLRPKHSKKDYSMLEKMSVGEIFDTASVKPKEVKFEEDNKTKYADMIKI